MNRERLKQWLLKMTRKAGKRIEYGNRKKKKMLVEKDQRMHEGNDIIKEKNCRKRKNKKLNAKQEEKRILKKKKTKKKERKKRKNKKNLSKKIAEK